VLSGLENPSHLLFLAIVLLLVFGPKRIPELGRALGTGIRDFRHSIAGDKDEGSASDPSGGGEAEQSPEPKQLGSTAAPPDPPPPR
jgi:sec-independent protein translocase protein TatA